MFVPFFVVSCPSQNKVISLGLGKHELVPVSETQPRRNKNLGEWWSLYFFSFPVSGRKIPERESPSVPNGHRSGDHGFRPGRRSECWAVPWQWWMGNSPAQPVTVLPVPRLWLHGRFWIWRTLFLHKEATSWPTNDASFLMDPSDASVRAMKRCMCLLWSPSPLAQKKWVNCFSQFCLSPLFQFGFSHWLKCYLVSRIIYCRGGNCSRVFPLWDKEAILLSLDRFMIENYEQWLPGNEIMGNHKMISWLSCKNSNLRRWLTG